MKHLEAKDLISLSETCKDAYLLTFHEEPWKRLYERDGYLIVLNIGELLTWNNKTLPYRTRYASLYKKQKTRSRSVLSSIYDLKRAKMYEKDGGWFQGHDYSSPEETRFGSKFDHSLSDAMNLYNHVRFKLKKYLHPQHEKRYIELCKRNNVNCFARNSKEL
jgi:hypothetical protein